MAEKDKIIKYSVGDLIEYPLSEMIAPFIRELGITPNFITISNILLRIYIFYFLINDNTGWHLVPLFILTQFLDCLDGTLARKYNQTSELGNILDHGSDMLFWGMLMVLTLYRTRNTKYVYIVLVVFFATLYSIYLKFFQDDAYYLNFLEMNGIIFILILYTCYVLVDISPCNVPEIDKSL